MSVKDRMYEPTQVEDFEEFLEKFPTSALFKAGTCQKTEEGFQAIDRALSPYPNIHLAFVQVAESRPLSCAIADITETENCSPQFILFIDGKAAFNLGPEDLTPEALNRQLSDYLATQKPKTKSNSA